MTFLGIDGGGSRTRFLLVDDADRELVHAETGSSNWVSAGPAAARQSITQGIQQLSPQPDIVCGGFAGAARPEAAEFYRATLEELLPQARIIIETDALVAYVGAIGLEPGVLLIAGTGSIALARGQNGEMIRVGGWGSVFGDEGSGFWIGREAIRTALRARDAGKAPEFVQAVTQAAHFEVITDVISAWAGGRIGPPEVAGLAPVLIGRYPAEPDRRILGEAAAELRQMVETAIERIKLPDCRKSIAGSLGSNPLMQRLIGISFVPPLQPPERGAILWARNQHPGAAADAKNQGPSQFTG